MGYEWKLWIDPENHHAGYRGRITSKWYTIPLKKLATVGGTKAAKKWQLDVGSSVPPTVNTGQLATNGSSRSAVDGKCQVALTPLRSVDGIWCLAVLANFLSGTVSPFLSFSNMELDECHYLVTHCPALCLYFDIQTSLVPLLSCAHSTTQALLSNSTPKVDSPSVWEMMASPENTIFWL